MKKSYYNFLFPGEEGKSILYNSRTGAMAELDEASVEQLEKMSEAELEEKTPDFANALLENGFAVEDGISELDMIKYDSLAVRYGNRELGLTIIPTLDCNLGCKYCYEKNVLESSYMDEETKNALVTYVEERVIQGEKLSICWYGGEPLLALDIIEELTERFVEICKAKAVEYNSSIVTNGYLLTKETMKRLLRCKVTKIQITLDGVEEKHDQRRCLKNGEPTYKVIWKNIKELKEYREEIQVHLRVNIDKENATSLNEIKRQIEEEMLEDFVYVYPGKVVAQGGCYSKKACFNSQEFAEIELEFESRDLKRLPRKYPKPKHNVCCADNNMSMVISSNGDMYKCWKDLGIKEKSIGNIKSEKVCNETLLYEYMLYDFTNDEACSKCKYLPVCLGGCPYSRVNRESRCSLVRYTLERYMKYFPSLMNRDCM